jgi:predicted esterase
VTGDCQTVATTVHGRFLLARPSGTPVGLLVGFHGYAEDADAHLAVLQTIPGVDRWLTVAVQALHPFYTRDQRIVANWMTSQDRELAIADNVDYVARVLEAVTASHSIRRPRVFAGFSQGGAMAYRAAAHHGADGLIVLGADVPPDISTMPSLRLPPILLGRGTADRWYTAEKHEADVMLLERAAANVQSCTFEGGHEWSADFKAAVSGFLGRFG